MKRRDMVFQNLLVPTDGSIENMAAVKTAVQMAKENGGKITALYVIDKSTYTDATSEATISKSFEFLEKEGNVAVAAVKKACDAENVPCEVRVENGSPHRCIEEASADFDLIIMGTLGRTGISKLMMGSVAEKVIKYSKCPVLVVRSKKGEKI